MDEVADAPRRAAQPRVPPGRRRAPQGPDRRRADHGRDGGLHLAAVAPVAAAALVATAWLAAGPRTADLAAHAYRAWLFEAEGFAVYDAQWYGGHHVPGYSLLFPPLAALLGAAGAVALAGAASAAALVALARDAVAAGPRREIAAWLAAAGAAANLVVGRGPFALGVAFAALALLAARHDRRALAAAAALACAWSSPVAALFLALIGGAWVLMRRDAAAFALSAAAVAAALSLAIAFPEGGADRFVATAFWPMLAVCAAATALLAHRRVLLAAGVLYLALLAGAFAVDTPVGQNALRLGVLAGPAVLAACGRGPRWALAAVAIALLYLQWLPAARAVSEASGDPATRASFHRPLIAFLEDAAAPGDRVEIPMTRNHWEAAEVAPHLALARGWERQLDVKVNGLFYDDRPLTPERYERWLRREGIRWVALPDAPPDLSARAEMRLLRSAALPFLRPAWRSRDWTVWEVVDAAPAVAGPARVVAAGPQEVALAVSSPGDVVVRRRFTRYWRVEAGRGCVTEAPGGWTLVRARAAGRLVLRAGWHLGAPPSC